MASITERLTAKGTAYRVRWARNGEWEGHTFDDPTDAEIFRALVNKCGGNRWPSAQELRARGFTALAEQREIIERRDQAATRITVVDMCRRYIDTDTETTAKGRKTYTAMLTNHIEPFFGSMTADAVTGQMIKDFQRHLVDTEAGPGVSAKTANNIRGGVLAPAFKRAAAPDLAGNPPLVPYNPCLSVKPLPVTPNRPEVWTQHEVSCMLDIARDIDPDAWALLAVLAGTGLRWSEAVAIGPQHVYADRGVVEIRRKAHRDAAARWVLVDTTKTAAGTRTVHVAGPVMDILTDRASWGRPVVLANRRGTLWHYEAFHDNQWAKIRAKVAAEGFTRKLTLHGLRHTATRMHEMGVDLYTLSAQLGHAYGTTLLMYGGPTGRNYATAVDALGTLVTGTAA
jgi:hypothetical protein